MDVIFLNQTFIDKKNAALTKLQEAIDEEIKSKVLPIIREGGFIPTVDHLIPSDISYSNFKYYRDRLNAIIDEMK